MPPIIAYIIALCFIAGDGKYRTGGIAEWLFIIFGFLILCGAGWGVVEAILWLVRHISISVV